jgi:formylglycine-generating enzyme required for sulfatase activity
MNKLLSVTLAALCLFVMLPPVHAKPVKTKTTQAAQPAKERLVLMPLRLGDEDQKLQGAMESALVDGLQQKYTVLWGEEVEKKAKEIFHKENQKHECNEERCMQGIAEAFQSELLATVIVTKQDSGYFLTLTIQNLYDHVVIFTRPLQCKGCDSFQVVDKLKELGVAAAPIATAPPVAVTPEAPIANAKASDPESITWIEAQKGNSIEDYQVYLDTYPKGKYLPFAKAKIKKLNDTAQAAVEQQEQQAWDTAQQDNTETGINRYLQGYPNGRFTGFAKSRLNKLKNDVAAREETEHWNKADTGNDPAAIETYLNKYPAGRYIAAASVKLKLLKEEAAKGPAMVRIPGKDYEMGKYEVTQAEWRAVMGNNPSTFKTCGDTCPVEQVSWDDVQTFLQKLSAKTGKQYRLPSEAEWEYACYGGSQVIPDSNGVTRTSWASLVVAGANQVGGEAGNKSAEYCGGNDLNAVAWISVNSNETTHPVGQKQANAYGLYDMSGNVAEWMTDCWEGNCARHVVRGGAWGSRPPRERASHRGVFNVSGLASGIGFRLARSLP